MRSDRLRLRLRLRLPASKRAAPAHRAAPCVIILSTTTQQADCPSLGAPLFGSYYRYPFFACRVTSEASLAML